ncbi:UDP-N-acetylglucosamine 1-carboxyvinyltransferase [Caedimonas varicaedens]|jgi:UDP-N-acetylglucosamine 1-carboxyvinyltransferase|uniref:UDP-N-acetylglucosamine 1-carboxyvinyltransferase n=1 Tax=Caedimonas varicaedens TaxID=1629334 RepID=A0A0K8MDN9_9PROT|nr:UDP-N-acetylglucosamine 1-carboxyvinyltransferase [Caedimonas varicaedens]
MDKIRIIGGTPLYGEIRISGAKNAALPLISASLLTDETLTLRNLPDLADVQTFKSLLAHLGVEITFDHDREGHHFGTLKASSIKSTEAPYDQVRKMRASFLVLGPLLAREGRAKVSLPGGCAIGARAIDMHLKGLECMGAHITLEDGYVIARAENGLRGVDYTFSSVTVTGTENLLMAATLAKGTTRLINAAREPEVSDLARCLIAMGAKIEGVGTDTLIIEGCSRLHGAEHPVLPDRIETGTYAMAAALTGGEVELTDTSLDLIPSVIPALESMGVLFEKTERGFKVKKQPGRLKATDVETEPYPGFATDLQAQIMVLAATAEGASVITETIFENRFMHVPELVRMGADIKLKGNTAFIRGVPRLKGAPVMATDLRASVSLVLAGLAAEDETIVNRVYHLDRGYEHIEKKLGDCGANIERIHGEVV